MDAFSKSPQPRQVPALRGHAGVLGAGDLFATVERLIARILADLKAYGITFNGQCRLNRETVRDTLRHEIGRALDGERAQLMLMHHGFDAEEAGASVDGWLRKWPQHMGVYVDVNRYLDDLLK